MYNILEPIIFFDLREIGYVCYFQSEHNIKSQITSFRV